MPPQMCNLTNLETLIDFVLGENSGSRIKELGALQLLHGSLRISGLENVVDVGDVLEADLKNKEFLTELILQWNGGETEDTSKEREVLNVLEPHRKLKKLRIEGYKGTLPSLRALKIREMCLSGIANECFRASLTISFPFLERLSMANMYTLERWPTGANQEGRLFPRLKRISLSSCDKLTVGLPSGRLPSLKSIKISFCVQMVSVFPTSRRIDNACPSLESIKLIHCEKVESFSNMGLPSNLKVLHIESCEKLIAKRRNWNYQRLSNLQTLVLIGCKDLGLNSFPEKGLLPSALTYLFISDFRKLKPLNGKGFKHLTSLQYLSIGKCDKLECLPEEGLPLSLFTLSIYECPMLSERCQRKTGEDWPKIQHIPNIYIDNKQV
ncbi:hypothetical protein TIFTF001_033592 [Ficus carica]|uniref:R13L1/DRL21-like LRR repeat region domain-containing protein n=1 Tax=Ficus carica TaxID=3494 RepID=A0AA88DYG6_FICCA|nr:hypothetical protein TIFTF001_033592 [Ficus carica]